MQTPLPYRTVTPRRGNDVLSAPFCKGYIYIYISLSDFVSSREIEDNIGVDIGISPNLMDAIPMRNYGDSNNVWT